MIRVGFTMNRTVQGWMGGVNYLRNLFHALQQVPNGDVQPILVVPPSTPQPLLDSFPPVPVVRTRWLERAPRVARRLLTGQLQRDFPMEHLLQASGIDVLSHSEHLGQRCGLPTIGWIADFQHVVMPEFFTPEELALRDQDFRRTLDASTLVVVGGQAAQRDLQQFHPAVLNKSRVLHFVSGYGESSASPSPGEMQAKYGFDEPYFHLPNQFWAHKNHRLVIEALACLKAGGKPPLVLATGQTHAYRQATHFEELNRLAHERGVDDRFRVLGMVPYAHVTALMRHAVAVINPSHFEGWSTSVEESKAFGLRILLSDIPVHREQAPERGIYFSPQDPTALASAMASALDTRDESDDPGTWSARGASRRLGSLPSGRGIQPLCWRPWRFGRTYPARPRAVRPENPRCRLHCSRWKPSRRGTRGCYRRWACWERSRCLTCPSSRSRCRPSCWSICHTRFRTAQGVCWG